MKDLVIREAYMKDGVEKVNWNKIGYIFESKGKQYVKLYHIPGELVYVLKQKKKEVTADQIPWNE